MRGLLTILLFVLPVLGNAQGDEVAAYVAGIEALADSSYQEAARWFERAIAQDPDYAEAYFGLAKVHEPSSPLYDEHQISRSLQRALRLEPQNPKYLEAQLEAYRRTMPESSAFSSTDTRRAVIANRLLAVDSTNALAHEELALNAFLEFDWRRQMARRQGGWDPDATGGTNGAANRVRARAEEHMVASLASNPENQRIHRLRLRLALLAQDDRALERAAHAYFDATKGSSTSRLYLGLWAHRTQQPEVAEQHFEDALSTMSADEASEFERVVHLMEETERQAFESDSTSARERFWRARDPRLLSKPNERRLEHYARMAATDLLFAESHKQLRGWATPRGEVVIRYGMPDASGRWMGADFANKRFGVLEQWVYSGEDGFSLVFEDPFRSGDFDLMSSSLGEDEVTRAENLFHRMPERYNHQMPGRLVDFPVRLATFRGVNGKTDLVASYGLPLPEVSEGIRSVDYSAGAFILDAEANLFAEARHRISQADPRISSLDSSERDSGGPAYVNDVFSVSLAPSDYTVAVEFESDDSEYVGVQRLSVDLPSYTGSHLQLSDVMLAHQIEEAPEAGVGQIMRHPFVISPASSNWFFTSEPVYLYVEMYNLRVEDGRTQYEIEAILRPVDHAGFLERAARSILGRSAPEGVSVSFSSSGKSSSEGQYVILDVLDQSTGLYDLEIRVHDLVSGATSESQTQLWLQTSTNRSEVERNRL